MPVLVGTSGWQYRDWRGVLYPAGLAERDWLEHYASRYGTVENNGTSVSYTHLTLPTN